MSRIESLTRDRLITIVSKPLCDLFERPTLFTKLQNRNVQKLLVLRINRRK